MSLAYSNTTNKNGIIQLIEAEIGEGNDGFISGNSTRLAQWTASINLALDKAFHIIFSAGGTWQFDDANHTNYPIITTNLVAGQQDYPFTTDEGSNLILDIYRVLVRNSTSQAYFDIYPADAQSQPYSDGLVDGLSTQGKPWQYDKTANGIFLDSIPDTSVTNGLKVYINREGSYFASSDTTKKAGFAGLYHEYLVLEPFYRHARKNNLANREALKRDVLEMEKNILEYYSRRQKDTRTILSPEGIDYE